MKIFVYYSEGGSTSCYPDDRFPSEHVVQIIECEETLAPITSFADPILISIGEVFACNDVKSNLIRIA